MNFARMVLFLITAVSLVSSGFTLPAQALPAQDDSTLSIIQAGKNLYLRQDGLIKGKLQLQDNLIVTFKDSPTPIVSVHLLDNRLAVIARVGDTARVGFYEKEHPKAELAGFSCNLTGKETFTYGLGDQIIISDGRTLYVVNPTGTAGVPLGLLLFRKSAPVSCAFNHHSASFAFHGGEFGSRLTSVDFYKMKERVIWESNTTACTCLADGGEDGFIAIAGHKQIEAGAGQQYQVHNDQLFIWVDPDPVKESLLTQEIISLYPLGQGQTLALKANGDIYKLACTDLAKPLNSVQLQVLNSKLSQILYSDGNKIIGVRDSVGLVITDMLGRQQQVFHLAPFQADNILADF